MSETHTRPAPIPDEATRRQIAAARPDVSTWLGANAGSGKTRVLTDRVARLLLAGTDPQSILCLTYTKAAAAEMQNRLFGRLGEWAMLDDEALRAALVALGVRDSLDGGILPRARRLFAAAIETPGGLKIQTIHAFCSLVLRRFPLEAGVTPGFRELDERGADEVLQAVLNDVAEHRPDVFAPCAAHVTGADMLGLGRAIVGKRRALEVQPTRAGLEQMLGLPPDLNEAMVRDRFLVPGLEGTLREMLPVLDGGKATDKNLADVIRSAVAADDWHGMLASLARGVLTLAGTRRKTLATKDVLQALGGLADHLDTLADRVIEARMLQVGLIALERHEAFHAFAAEVLNRFEAAKLRRGVLDFDDLVDRTHALLHRPGVAEWVLYKLDGGIDHVLVDEAQDTAPRQWQVIAKLTEEFTAHAPAPGSPARTLFVVGDFKQSIYSFQGADPARFHEMRTHFEAAHARASLRLHEEALEHSFRSAPAVLDVVDRVFDGAPEDALGGPVRHLAFKDSLPGRVDLWPVLARDHARDEVPWYSPVDAISTESDRFVLASSIADDVARMIREERLPTKDGARAIHAGDILVLVRGRVSGLFDAIISACKTRGIAVAGADRLKLEAEVAVQDILALLRWIDTTDDDLSLAAALRSPLFGWSEDELHRLAQPRPEHQTLWVALRTGHAGSATVTLLQDLLDSADFLRPFDLIDRMLTRHNGRARLVARLGPEAEDGIDAILSRARGFEREHTASLTGFLAWMEAGDTDIKRQAEGAGRALRVMTVHGAKGLEAPIVILPDTADRRDSLRGDILESADGRLIWKSRKEDWTAATHDLAEEQKEADAAENQRLLYVAMTRAEIWLIVCAAGKAEKVESWHAQVAGALDRLGAPDLDTPTGNGRRHASFDWPAAGSAVEATERSPATVPAPPEWAFARAPAPTPLRKVMTASGLPGAKALPGDGLEAEEAMRRGTLMHRLLEDLPLLARGTWGVAAADILRAADPTLPEAIMRELATRACALLDQPDLQPLFAPDTLAEVGVAANLPGFGPFHGIIDRLILSEGHVHAIDYKTNRTVPARAQDIPAGILAQMGAYALGLKQVYPSCVIRLSILWTQTGVFMDVPEELALKTVMDAAPA